MAQYPPLDSVYGRPLGKVWLWKDWPKGGRARSTLELDLVAEEIDTPVTPWAIQCKFYEPDHVLGKTGRRLVLSASGKHPFAHRLIISTTDKWGKC